MPLSPRTCLLLTLTHAMVMALGYAGWRAATTDDSQPAGANEPKPWKVNRDRGDGRPRRSETEDDIRAERLRRGEALLARITEVNEVMPGSARGLYQAVPVEEIARLADELPPAADIRETIAELEGKANSPGGTLKDARELGARYLQWLRADAAAAVTHFSKVMEDERARSVFNLPDLPLASLEICIREKGWAAMMAYNDPKDSDWMKPSIIKEFARQGDPSRLRELAALPGWDEKDAFITMSKSWPLEKADAFLKMSGWQSGEQLAAFAAAHGDSGMKWLMARLKSPEMDAQTRWAVEHDYTYARYLRRTPQLDPAVRAVYLDGHGEQPPDRDTFVREESIRLLATDIPRLLEEGRDWRYAFRHGVVTADQLLEEMRKQMPQMAESQPEKLRDILFKELAKDNAPAAMALLADLPEEERWKKALESHGSQGPGGDDPRKFAAFIRQMPPEVAEGLWEERLAVWERVGRDKPLMGAAYVDWLQELPQTDREMAVYHLTRGQQDKMPPPRALRIRLEKMAAAITDPGLRAKMEGGK